MRGPSEDQGSISPQTVAGAGLLVAVAGLILAGVAGAPYLSSDGCLLYTSDAADD